MGLLLLSVELQLQRRQITLNSISMKWISASNKLHASRIIRFCSSMKRTLELTLIHQQRIETDRHLRMYMTYSWLRLIICALRQASVRRLKVLDNTCSTIAQIICSSCLRALNIHRPLILHSSLSTPLHGVC